MEFCVEDDEAGVRLDVLLVRRVEGMGRAAARRSIQDGHVRRNGRRTKKGVRLDPGDKIELDEIPAPRDFDVVAAPDAALEVLLETPDLVIVDKPAGQPTHPLRPDESQTLANALIGRYPEMIGVGYARREPGILHRLDNDTSGAVLAARSAEAFDALRRLLKSRGIEKEYRAMVDGHLGETFTISMPIAPHPSDPRRVHVCLDSGDRRLPAARPAETIIDDVRAIEDRTLVVVRAPLAVRHQIRAHLAAIGHPLVGDWLYGGPANWLGRHFLHASRIAFTDPLSGASIDVRVPLPDELAALIG